MIAKCDPLTTVCVTNFSIQILLLTHYTVYNIQKLNLVCRWRPTFNYLTVTSLTVSHRYITQRIPQTLRTKTFAVLEAVCWVFDFLTEFCCCCCCRMSMDEGAFHAAAYLCRPSITNTRLYILGDGVNSASDGTCIYLHTHTYIHQ